MKKAKFLLLKKTIFLLFIVSFFISFSALSGGLYISSADGNWNDPATWLMPVPGKEVFPTKDDNVIIMNHKVVLDRYAHCARLNIASGELVVKDGIDIHGDLYIGSLGKLSVNMLYTEPYYKMLAGIPFLIEGSLYNLGQMEFKKNISSPPKFLKTLFTVYQEFTNDGTIKFIDDGIDDRLFVEFRVGDGFSNKGKFDCASTGSRIYTFRKNITNVGEIKAKYIELLCGFYGHIKDTAGAIWNFPKDAEVRLAYFNGFAIPIDTAIITFDSAAAFLNGLSTIKRGNGKISMGIGVVSDRAVVVFHSPKDFFLDELYFDPTFNNFIVEGGSLTVDQILYMYGSRSFDKLLIRKGASFNLLCDDCGVSVVDLEISPTASFNMLGYNSSLWITNSFKQYGDFFVPKNVMFSPLPSYKRTDTISFISSQSSIVFNNLTIRQYPTIPTPLKMVVQSDYLHHSFSHIVVKDSLVVNNARVDLGARMITMESSPKLSIVDGWFYNSLFRKRFDPLDGPVVTGSTTSYFPVGSVSYTRPFYVGYNTAPTLEGYVTVSYVDKGTTSSVSFRDGINTIQKRRDDFWIVSSYGLSSTVDYNIQASYPSIAGVANIDDLRLTLYDKVVGQVGKNFGTSTSPTIVRQKLQLNELNNVFYIGSINSVRSPLSLVAPVAPFVEKSEDKEISICPNPSVVGDIIQVKLPSYMSYQEDDSISFEVINAMGSRIYTQEDVRMTLSGTIDLIGMVCKKGIYTLKLTYKDKIFYKRFLVN